MELEDLYDNNLNKLDKTIQRSMLKYNIKNDKINSRNKRDKLGGYI